MGGLLLVNIFLLLSCPWVYHNSPLYSWLWPVLMKATVVTAFLAVSCVYLLMLSQIGLRLHGFKFLPI